MKMADLPINLPHSLQMVKVPAVLHFEFPVLQDLPSFFQRSPCYMHGLLPILSSEKSSEIIYAVKH